MGGGLIVVSHDCSFRVGVVRGARVAARASAPVPAGALNRTRAASGSLVRVWGQVVLFPDHRRRRSARPARSVGGARTAPARAGRSRCDDGSVDEPQVVHGFVDGFEGEVPVAGLGYPREFPCCPVELLLCDVVVGSVDGESPVALRLDEPFGGGVHADDLLPIVLVRGRLVPPRYHRKPARARLSGACVGPRGGEQ